jgi:hypothetical protein
MFDVYFKTFNAVEIGGGGDGGGDIERYLRFKGTNIADIVSYVAVQ